MDWDYRVASCCDGRGTKSGQNLQRPDSASDLGVRQIDTMRPSIMISRFDFTANYTRTLWLRPDSFSLLKIVLWVPWRSAFFCIPQRRPRVSSRVSNSFRNEKRMRDVPFPVPFRCRQQVLYPGLRSGPWMQECQQVSHPISSPPAFLQLSPALVHGRPGSAEMIRGWPGYTFFSSAKGSRLPNLVVSTVPVMTWRRHGMLKRVAVAACRLVDCFGSCFFLVWDGVEGMQGGRGGPCFTVSSNLL